MGGIKMNSMEYGAQYLGLLNQFSCLNLNSLCFIVNTPPPLPLAVKLLTLSSLSISAICWESEMNLIHPRSSVNTN